MTELPKTQTVAVLGTGLMGSGMARSLARADFRVRVWNRTADKARALADVAEVCEDPAQAVTGADAVITMLFDADAAAEVMRQTLPAFGEHTIWVQSGTTGLDGAGRLAELAAQHQVTFVDGPVQGTRGPAEQGNLVVIASGPAEAGARLEGVFNAIGRRTVWVGAQPGEAQRLKLAVNSWMLALTAAVGQTVSLTRDLGLDPRLFLEVIADGPLDCGYAQIKGKAMIEGSFAPDFSLGGALKDSSLILAAMDDAGTEETLMRALRDEYRAAAARGHAEEDMAAVVHAFH